MQNKQKRTPNANAADATPATVTPAIWGLVRAGGGFGTADDDAGEAMKVADEEEEEEEEEEGEAVVVVCVVVRDADIVEGWEEVEGVDDLESVEMAVGKLEERADLEGVTPDGLEKGNPILWGKVVVLE